MDRNSRRRGICRRSGVRSLVLSLVAIVSACGGLPEPPASVPRPERPPLEPLERHVAAVETPTLRPPRAAPPILRWQPVPPEEGTLFVIIVEPRAGALPIFEMQGTSDGRAIGFIPTGDGGFLGLVAAPLESRELPIELEVRLVDGTLLHEKRRAPVAARDFPSTRLSVARRFTAPGRAALERIRRERELVRGTIRGVTPERLWNGAFRHPRPGAVTSPFGQKRMFNNELRSRHTGLDLRADRGTPVYATNSGRVAVAADLYFTGNTVYLDHGFGLYTAYFHLSEIDVLGVGQWVERGERIGRVGATGRVTGPHLHWGVYLHGIPLDPLSLLAPEFTRIAERLQLPHNPSGLAARP